MRRSAVKVWKTVFTTFIVLVILVAISFSFMPSIFDSVHNGSKKECYNNSYKLLRFLSNRLNGTEDNKIWYDLVYEQNSNKLLSALKKQVDEDMKTSQYYIKFTGTQVKILCRNHNDAVNVAIDIPDNVVLKESKYIEPLSPIVTKLEVTGRDMYFQNSILDPANPEKTLFSDRDNISYLFPDIHVSAHYAGGGERVLNPDEYKIRVGSLDMTKTGKQTFIIEYNNPINPPSTSFEIELLANDKREPLIADGGIAGKFELASWVWTDYVADAMEAPGSYMEFDASIVFDDGDYFYYPDGFVIIKSHEDNGSVKGAKSIDNHKKEAYKIKFDTNAVVHTDNVAQTIARDGTLKVDDGIVYIWQEQPSKEAKDGWLRVYCEMKPLE